MVMAAVVLPEAPERTAGAADVAHARRGDGGNSSCTLDRIRVSFVPQVHP